MSAVSIPAARAARAEGDPAPGAAVRADEIPLPAVHRLHHATAVVLMIGIGALFSAVTASQYHTFMGRGPASTPSAPA